MPETPSRRVIKAHSPTGSYAAGTAAQLQGRGSNKTQQYLDSIDPQNPGQQAFYREALTGIANPLQAGAQVSYGQFQDMLAGPQRTAALEALAQQQGVGQLTAQQAQQMAFDSARARLLARAAEAPGEYAFPPAADAALRAPNTQTAIAHGNYVQPAAGVVQDAASMAQRYADLSTQQGTMTAPGMSAQPLTRTIVATPAPARVAKRVIRGTPIIAGN